MLESNTDRSYFMIGAVIVAGLIIAGAVTIFKDQIFGTEGILSSTFTNLTRKATGMIDGIDVDGPDVQIPGAAIMNFGVYARAALGAMFL